jgi:hypothetical protein
LLLAFPDRVAFDSLLLLVEVKVDVLVVDAAALAASIATLQTLSFVPQQVQQSYGQPRHMPTWPKNPRRCSDSCEKPAAPPPRCWSSDFFSGLRL